MFKEIFVFIILIILLSGCINSSDLFNEIKDSKPLTKLSKDEVKKIDPIEVKKFEPVKPIVFNNPSKENPCLTDGNANTLFVGKWRPWSKAIYFSFDDWKTLPSGNGVLELCKDFSWSFADPSGTALNGTWEEKEIEESDWNRWEKISSTQTMGKITRKENLFGRIVLNGWETDSTSFVDGPLESLSFLWLYYTGDFEGKAGKIQFEFKKIPPEQK